MISRKWAVRLALGFVGFLVIDLVILIVEWKVTRSRGEARRATAVAKLDAEDPLWRTTDLTTTRNKALPPKERNSAERAKGVKPLLPAEYKEWQKDSQWTGELKSGVLPHEEDICAAAAAHAACSEALTVARSIRELPEGGLEFTFHEPDLIGTLMPYTQDMREVGALLQLDAAVLVYSGDADGALRSTHAILHVARGLGDEPTLISQLVRMAMVAIARSSTERVIGLGEPSAELAALQAAFAREQAEPRMTYGLRGERAMFVKMLDNIDDGSFRATEGLGIKSFPGSRVGERYFSKYIPGQQATAIDLFGQYMAADKLPPAERQAALAAIAFPPRGLANLYIGLLMPAVQKVSEADTRTQAFCATTVVALACERYRRKAGAYPVTLAELPKDILATVPTDPYTGKPVLYKRLPDGAVVYTVGKDGFDDGGANLDPKGEKGMDVGFRLWNPDRRRQQPPPKEPLPGDFGGIGGPSDDGPDDR